MATPQDIGEITTIADIQTLTMGGFEDWAQYGDVNVTAYDDLRLFNYTTLAQMAARWNFFERVSRGLLINAANGQVVARPFDKIFNWLEGGRKVSGHIVTVTEKLDGSLGILFRTSAGYQITTRGSLHSKQARWATAFLNAHFALDNLPTELTLLFEILYPDNRIVVDYAGREDLVLLAARNRFTGAYLPFFPDVYHLAQQYGFSLPKVHDFNNVDDIIRATGTLDEHHEGWVAEFSDGQRFKFKGDRYVELHKLISGLTFKNVLTAVARGTIDYMLDTIPDEFLDEVKTWREEIAATVDDVTDRVLDAFYAAPRESRKDFALWVQAHHPDLAGYLFAMYDEKPLPPLIYKREFQQRLAAAHDRMQHQSTTEA